MGRKVLAVIFAAMIALSFAGCGETGTASADSGQTAKIYNDDVFEFVDPDTGVHYWIYSSTSGYGGMGGMTPRLNADGSIMADQE